MLHLLNMNKINYVKFLLFLLFVSNLSKLNASHISGADMYYQSLGNQKYKIIAKLYRDCRGVPTSSTIYLNAYGGKSGSVVCGKVQVGSMTRTKIVNITNVCVDSLPCNPQNQYGTGNGLEEHTYELVVDFSTSPLNSMSQITCPEIVFNINECCRNGSITTGSAGNDFYATCMISIGNLRKCLKQQNTSPQWVNKPVARVCCNIPWYYNSDALDTVDFDSISYHLVPGISALPNTSITYSAPFTYKFPMTPFCLNSTVNCTPKPFNNPPIGFYFDSLTGDMIVTPTKCDESAVINIEQREYRKDSFGRSVLIGYTHRDFQINISGDCGKNTPPMIMGNSILNVIEGQKICETIIVNDSMSNNGDSFNVSWNQGIKGATFTLIGQKPGQKKYEFCWQTQIGDGNKMQCGFAVSAVDNHCTPIMNSTRNFIVKVIKQSTSVNSKVADANFKIYPNPTNGKLKIEVPMNFANSVLIVKNNIGQTIAKVNLGTLKFFEYELSGLPGMYVFELSSADATLTRKIFKN